MEEINYKDRAEQLAFDKEILDYLTRLDDKCYDDDGNDITAKYTELAKTIQADENGIKEYRQTRYTCEDGKWFEYPKFDSVLCYKTEEKLLQHIDEWEDMCVDIPREKRVGYLTDDETRKLIINRIIQKVADKNLKKNTKAFDDFNDWNSKRIKELVENDQDR